MVSKNTRSSARSMSRNLVNRRTSVHICDGSGMDPRGVFKLSFLTFLKGSRCRSKSRAKRAGAQRDGSIPSLVPRKHHGIWDRRLLRRCPYFTMREWRAKVPGSAEFVSYFYNNPQIAFRRTEAFQARLRSFPRSAPIISPLCLGCRKLSFRVSDTLGTPITKDKLMGNHSWPAKV